MKGHLGKEHLKLDENLTASEMLKALQAQFTKTEYIFTLIFLAKEDLIINKHQMRFLNKSIDIFCSNGI